MAQEFRDGINKAARDISLAAWSDSGRTVPQDADTAAVKRELNAFRQAVAGLKTWASQQV